MHFVDKSGVSEETLDALASLTETETPKWEQHFADKKNNPRPKAFWTQSIIREPLVAAFKQNCGYCGEFTRRYPTQSGENAYEGQVEHECPKSKVTDLTYDWKNYVWSCQACNQRKGTYFDEELPILSPCSETDCSALGYSSGIYFVKKEVKNHNTYKARLDQTELKTFINIEDTVNQRKRFANKVHEELKSIENKIELVSIGVEEEEIVVEKVNDLVDMLKVSSFKFLVRDIILPPFLEEPQNKKYLDKIIEQI